MVLCIIYVSDLCIRGYSSSALGPICQYHRPEEVLLPLVQLVILRSLQDLAVQVIFIRVPVHLRLLVGHQDLLAPPMVALPLVVLLPVLQLLQALRIWVRIVGFWGREFWVLFFLLLAQ